MVLVKVVLLAYELSGVCTHARVCTSMAQHLLPASHGSIGFKRGSPAAAEPVSNDQLLRSKLNHYLVLGPGQEGVSVSQQKGKCATCNAGFTFRLARIAAHFAKKGGFGVGACTQPPAEAVALSLQVFEVQKAKVQKVAGKEDSRGAGAGLFDQTPPGMVERGGGTATHEAYAQQWASGTGRPADYAMHPHPHAETSLAQHPSQPSLGPIGFKRGTGNPFISTAATRRTVPNDQVLRSKLNKFLVISPDQEGVSVSQQKGRCGTCDMSFTFRLLRIAAHFTRQVGNGVGPCTEPPAEAVALAFKVLEVQKAKARKIVGKAGKGAGLLEQTSPDMVEGGAGAATQEACAQQGVSGTGRSAEGAAYAHTHAGTSTAPHLPEDFKRSVGLKRSTATLLNDQLRSKLGQFLVLNPGQEGLSVSQQKGQCGTCSMSFTFRLLRIAAHFTKQSGKGVGPCTQPPAEAVALSLKVFEVLKATVQKAGGKESKDAGLLDKRASAVAERGVTRAATHQAYAQWVLGTGQSFNAGRNPLFKKFVKAVIKDPQWHPEDRRTLATTRLDAETERVRKDLSAWIGEDAEKFGCTIALDAWTNGQVLTAVKILY